MRGRGRVIKAITTILLAGAVASAGGNAWANILCRPLLGTVSKTAHDPNVDLVAFRGIIERARYLGPMKRRRSQDRRSWQDMLSGEDQDVSLYGVRVDRVLRGHPSAAGRHISVLDVFMCDACGQAGRAEVRSRINDWKNYLNHIVGKPAVLMVFPLAGLGDKRLALSSLDQKSIRSGIVPTYASFACGYGIVTTQIDEFTNIFNTAEHR